MFADFQPQPDVPDPFAVPSASAVPDNTVGDAESVENLKVLGNESFKKGKLLRKTTAGKQYINDAKRYYAQALQQLSAEVANRDSLELAGVLHSNLAAVYLSEVPPKWEEAKAAANIALSVEVGTHRVKALFRRAQAELEDNREGLPETNLRAALSDLVACLQLEPGNSQASAECERVQKRICALESARRLPNPREIAGKVNGSLLDRGSDCLETHGYLWGQTESLVHIFVPARGVRISASEVVCEVRPSSLRIGLLSDGTPFELSGRLHKMVHVDESSWQLEDRGLLLHVELAKRDDGSQDEHWFSVWEGHAKTMAPSARERKKIKDMADAACRQEAQERASTCDPDQGKKDEILKRYRDICPGINVEWGDTSLESFRDA